MRLLLVSSALTFFTGTCMTFQRILFATSLVAILPMLVSISKAEVLSKDVVIDDHHANPNDFREPVTATEKPEQPVIIAACDGSICKES